MGLGFRAWVPWFRAQGSWVEGSGLGRAWLFGCRAVNGLGFLGYVRVLTFRAKGSWVQG